MIKGIEIIDLALYIRDHKALVISDTHIGHGGELQEKGVLIPDISCKEQESRIRKIINSVNKKKGFDTIIINGDFKHEFGRINDSEWRSARKFLEIFDGKRVIITKGNHDKVLKGISDRLGIRLVDFIKLDDILICHGDKIIDAESKTIIIGHEHPAINIGDDRKKELFKCYLIGKYKDKALIVQPSFKLFSKGTDIMDKRILSPYIKDVKEFEAIIVDKKIYNFGKIKKFYL